MPFYTRKPVVVLPDLDQESDAEKGQQLEDSLDRHVDDVLKRPSKFKRTMQGVWSFLKTRAYCSSVASFCDLKFCLSISALGVRFSLLRQ
jgi:hypothetical protein